jgi:hypothetical protein
MAELTVWSLPKALLAALPETAPVLAALAADAFDLDADDLAEVAGDAAAPGRRQDSDDAADGAGPAEGTGAAAADGPSRLDRINAILGMNLHAEFGAYRVLGAVLDEVLLKAIGTQDDDLAARCCEFLEAVLGSGDAHLRDAVALMVLENAQWTDERWSALLRLAGPLLRQEMESRPRG